MAKNSEKVIFGSEKEIILIDIKNKTSVRDTSFTDFEPSNNRCTFSNNDKHIFLVINNAILQVDASSLAFVNSIGIVSSTQKQTNIAGIATVPNEKKLIAIDYDGTVGIFTDDSLSKINTYQTNYGRTNGLKVSPIGNTLAISTFSRYTGIINFPEFTAGSYLYGSATDMWKIVATSTNDKLCISSIQGDIRVADPETGKVTKLITYDSSRLEEPKFSIDGKKILTAAHNGKKLICWNSETGEYLFSVLAEKFIFYNYCFNPSGKNFVAWEAVEKKLTIRDASNGKELYKYYYQNRGGKGNAITYTADGKWLLVSNYTSIEIREANTGKLVRLLKATQPATTVTNKQKLAKGETILPEVKTIEISPDGTLVTAITSSSIMTWNFSTGKVVLEKYQETKNKKEYETDFISIHFSPDSKKIVLGINDGRIAAIDIATKKIELKYRAHNSYTLLDAIYSPDQKKIITIGSKFGYLVLYPLYTENDAIQSGEMSEEISGYSLTKSGKEILTISGNSLRKYNIETGKLLYQTIFINDNDWLCYDTLGRFDGTEAARKLLYFTCGKEIIELEQVKDLLWVPNLAERINNGDTITSKMLADIDICSLTPLVEISKIDTDNYHYLITPRRGGLGNLILQVNGIDVKYYTKEALTAKGSEFELIIPKGLITSYFVAGQENKVSLKALTADNTISSRNVIIDEDLSKTPSTPPNLYAIVVGVSDYKGTELDLKYATKDAIDFADVLGNASKKLLNTDTVNHVYVYNINTDQKGKLFPEKNNIKNALIEISKKATASDILLIFFAGHGVMEGEKKQFYFLTADASKTTATDNISEVAISTAELSEWIKPENIKAQKRVLIFDACNSGQAINDLIKIGGVDQGYTAARNDEKTQQIKAIDKLNEKTGLFILSASASNQSAYEMSKYSQGLLTYSLLKAIKEESSILYNNRFLDLGKWFNRAKESVEEMSKETGARQEPQIVSNTNFIIGLVDDEVLSKIKLPEAKPVFDASNFQNANPLVADDDLELSKLLNKQLSEISLRNVNNKIIYAHATAAADAFTLTGRYTITDSQIIVKINLKQNKKVLQQYEVSGSKDVLEKLGEEIIATATQFISQLKNK